MKKKVLKMMLFLLLAVPVVYILVQVGIILHDPYVTQTAIQYTLADSVQLDGVVSFEQQEISGSGQIGYLARNGERVSSGAPVAELYESGEQARSRALLLSLQHQSSLLERSQNASGTDVGVQLAQIQGAVYDLLDGLDRHNPDLLKESQDQYLLAANKLQIITGKAKDFSPMLQELAARQDELAGAIGTPQAVSAPAGGYFISMPQARFLNVSTDELAQATPTQLQDMLNQGMEVRKDDCIGKVVTSYRWRFYGVCPGKLSERFTVGKKVNISFPEKAESPLPAKIVAVDLDKEHDLAKITIECEYTGSQVLTLGQQPAQIDFADYQGLRIDAEALHIVDGEKCVYVKHGNLARLRKIQVVYQNDDYILVPRDGKLGGDSEVRLFDEVIVRGSDLRDGKLL